MAWELLATEELRLVAGGEEGLADLVRHRPGLLRRLQVPLQGSISLRDSHLRKLCAAQVPPRRGGQAEVLDAGVQIWTSQALL